VLQLIFKYSDCILFLAQLAMENVYVWSPSQNKMIDRLSYLVGHLESIKPYEVYFEAVETVRFCISCDMVITRFFGLLTG
jgi:hypothetical protein